MSMSSLTRYGNDVSSVFDLLGQNENDLTAALAFSLASSPGLLHLILRRLNMPDDAQALALHLEKRDDLGRTDLEIDAGTHLAVIEAKRGWLLPGETQLTKYVPRIKDHGTGCLVSLSAASTEWARQVLPPAVGGIPVIHYPWNRLQQDLRDARTRARGQERAWLNEFSDYLRKAIKMRDPADSWTYCVALSNGRPGGGGTRTNRDFVTAERCYFHPHGWGSGWPKTPPNFLAFRWNNQVQQIRRVTSTEVIPDLQSRWPDIPKAEGTIRPHVLYHLGPPLPGTPIPSGGKYRASRVWFVLDQLLVSQSLHDAILQSKLITAT